MDDPKHLTPTEIALIDWFCRDPNGRVLHHDHGIGMSEGWWHFMEGVPGDDASRIATVDKEREVEIVKDLFGRRKVEMGRLMRLGFVGYPTPARLKGRSKTGGYRSSDFMVGKAGFEYWQETGRAIHARNAEGYRAAREADKRTVVIGVESVIRPELPSGYRAPGETVRLATYIATVTKATEKRLYVEDVRNLVKPSGYDGVVKGRAPNQYVEIGDVVMDHATMSDARRLVRLDEDHVQSIKDIQAGFAAVVQKAHADMERRLMQKRAEREDELREVAGVPDAPGPAGP